MESTRLRQEVAGSHRVVALGNVSGARARWWLEVMGGGGRAPVALEECELPPPSNTVRWVTCRNCGRLVSGAAIGSSAGSSRTGSSSAKDSVTMVMSASPVSSTSVRSLVNSASQKSDTAMAAAAAATDGRPTPTPATSACTSYPTFPSHSGPVLGDDGKSVYCGVNCYWSDALDPSAVRLRVAQGPQKPQLAAVPTAAKGPCAAKAAPRQRPAELSPSEGTARAICATDKVPTAETDAFTGMHAMYEHHAYFAGTFRRQVGLAPLQRYGHRGTIIAPTADRAARYRSSRPPLTSNPRCRVAAI